MTEHTLTQDCGCSHSVETVHPRLRFVEALANGYEDRAGRAHHRGDDRAAEAAQNVARNIRAQAARDAAVIEQREADWARSCRDWEAEAERLRDVVQDWQIAARSGETIVERLLRDRAEKAEAALARVRALADEWSAAPLGKSVAYEEGWDDAVDACEGQLRAALDGGPEECSECRGLHSHKMDCSRRGGGRR